MVQIGEMLRLEAKNGVLVDYIDEVILINKVIVMNMAQDNALDNRKQTEAKIQRKNKRLVRYQFGKFGHPG